MRTKTVSRMLARKGDGLRRGPARTIVGGTSPKETARVPARKPSDTTTYSGRIGARVRKLRTDNDMSVEGLRDALRRRGVELSISMVYAIENGSRSVDVNHLPAIAAALGCKSVLDILPPK